MVPAPPSLMRRFSNGLYALAQGSWSSRGPHKSAAEGVPRHQEVPVGHISLHHRGRAWSACRTGAPNLPPRTAPAFRYSHSLQPYAITFSHFLALPPLGQPPRTQLSHFLEPYAIWRSDAEITEFHVFTPN